MSTDKKLIVAGVILVLVGSVASQGIRFPDQDPPRSDPSVARLGSALDESGNGPEATTDQPSAENASSTGFAT